MCESKLWSQALTMSWGGIKIKRIHQVGSIFGEVIRLKRILALRAKRQQRWCFITEW